MRKIRTFDTIEKQCIWCHSKFVVTWKYRHQKMCSRNCMYEWRIEQNWEDTICRHCGKTFSRRKADRNHRNGRKRIFCSNECNRISQYKKRKLRKWGKSKSNHWNSKEFQKASKKTKLEKYGDCNYNNAKKMKKTLIERYGVTVGFNTHKSNGHKISKPQRKVYKYVKSIYKKSKLEHLLKDAGMSVDIYIPETNTVIEVNGDYWHMNPLKYVANDYNKNLHLTAKEVWQRDKERILTLKSAGYNVVSLWESEIKQGRHELIIE